MLNPISFTGLKINQTNPPSNNKAVIIYKKDAFERSFEQEKLNKVLDSARENILKEIKENNREYGYVISKTGEILDENSGSDHSVRLDMDKVEKDSILIHGHPKNYPLSTKDVVCLLVSDAKSQEAYTVDSKFSRLTKKYPQKLDVSAGTLDLDFKKELYSMALEELGIDYSIKEKDVRDVANQYLSRVFSESYEDKSDEEIVSQLRKVGVELSGDLDKDHAEISKMLYFVSPYSSITADRKHQAIMDNIEVVEKFLSTDDGIEIQKKFIENIAREYDLIYETDM